MGRAGAHAEIIKYRNSYYSFFVIPGSAAYIQVVIFFNRIQESVQTVREIRVGLAGTVIPDADGIVFGWHPINFNG